MMRQKKVLIVIDSLGIGGAEKSLISLLGLLDFSRYQIDLQLFAKGGAFEKNLPREVNVLQLPAFNIFLSKNILSQLSAIKFKWIVARILFSLKLICNKGLLHRTVARYFWQTCRKCYKQTQQYDVAIAYGQGLPTFYVADSVVATKKLAWINAEYLLEGKDKQFQDGIYKIIDCIVAVSDTVKRQFECVYPHYVDKMVVMPDLINAQLITKLSKEYISDEIDISRPIIITVARLDKNQKGYDILLDTCNKLTQINNNFTWYIIGDGEYREEMKVFIKRNALTQRLILLGAKSNPYPYMAKASIYVQTSRNEGFGLSIAEALILNIPVVTTKFDCVHKQIHPNKNGIVCPLKSDDIAEQINKLLVDSERQQEMRRYIMSQPKGNMEEIRRFYDLIDSRYE